MDAAVAAGLVLPGLGTGLGGLVLLAARRPSRRTLDVLGGFTAGIMLAATVFSLLVPALDEGSIGEVLVGFTLGALLIGLADRLLPHGHPGRAEHHRGSLEQAEARSRARLILTALTIHNVPEGLAVGIAYGAGGADAGVAVAVAIGVQNVPEGFAAAAPLVRAGARVGFAAAIAAATGLVEPVAAIAGYFAAESAGNLLAGGLAFAAGAMLYVVVDELVPDSIGRGDEQEATAALLIGFALMLVLDTQLG